MFTTIWAIIWNGSPLEIKNSNEANIFCKRVLGLDETGNKIRGLI